MTLKRHTFTHPSAILSYTARQKENAFLVTVAPSQLQNTVTYTMGRRCPQNDSSRLRCARGGAQAAPRTGFAPIPASPPPPPPSQRAPRNPRNNSGRREGPGAPGKPGARRRDPRGRRGFGATLGSGAPSMTSPGTPRRRRAATSRAAPPLLLPSPGAPQQLRSRASLAPRRPLT